MLCDEPYMPSHYLKHKKAQLVIFEGDKDKDGEMEQEVEHAEVEPVVNSEPAAIMQLSINALTGTPTYQTMRVSGL